MQPALRGRTVFEAVEKLKKVYPSDFNGTMLIISTRRKKNKVTKAIKRIKAAFPLIVIKVEWSDDH